MRRHILTYTNSSLDYVIRSQRSVTVDLSMIDSSMSHDDESSFMTHNDE